MEEIFYCLDCRACCGYTCHCYDDEEEEYDTIRQTKDIQS
jgi:hypothetical protein